MARPLKRSWQPPFWLAFGAGGMLAALVGPMLVWITAFAPVELLAHDNVRAFAGHGLGKLFLVAVVSLFLFHGVHRVYHWLHDFGIRPGPAAWIACYGLAIGGTLAAIYGVFTVSSW